MQKTLLLLGLIILCSFKKTPCLHPYQHHVLHLAEPSDICLSPLDNSRYFIVSNRGCIGETDENGKVLRHTKYDGSDYEAICTKDTLLYAIDESLRRIDVVRPSDLKVMRSVYLHYNGPRNKGFEGVTYMPDRKKFITVTEKPVMIFELNDELQVINQIMPKQFTELSSVTYHDGWLWFLGDEQHEVMKVSPIDYTIVQRWQLPVVNPEGINFDKDGSLLIVSDDMSELFKFKLQ